jgi:hypothetical protein
MSALVSEAKTSAAARVRRWPEETGLLIAFLLMILAIGIPYPEFLVIPPRRLEPPSSPPFV